MIRLLIVLLVVGLCAWYLGAGSSPAGKPVTPQERHAEETAKARSVEAITLEQAAGQLEQIDEQTR